MPIRLRRHHVLCALTYEGLGYSAAFSANIARLVNGGLRSEAGDATEILITAQADAFCAPCPHRSGLACTTEDVVTSLDARHGAALGVTPGDRLTWADCRARVLSRIEPADLEALCAGCGWLASGSCRASLARQIAETKTGRPKAARTAS